MQLLEFFKIASMENALERIEVLGDVALVAGLRDDTCGPAQSPHDGDLCWGAVSLVCDFLYNAAVQEGSRGIISGAVDAIIGRHVSQ